MDDQRLSVEHTTSTGHRLLYYDGACNNVHGHNFRWEVDARVEYPDDDTGMAIDLKAIKAVLDEFDHALVLNEKDPLAETLGSDQDTVVLSGDPTCENTVEYVADVLMDRLPIKSLKIRLHETSSYSVSTSRHHSDI